MAIAHALTDTTADISSVTATTTITKPTGSNATHRLVLIICTENGSGTNTTINSTPSGWTRIGSQVITGNFNNEKVAIDCFHAAGDVSALGFGNSNTGANFQQGWVCAAFSGVDTTTPIDATGTGNTSTGSATLTTNAVTIATDQSWHLIGVGSWLSSGTHAATGFTVKSNAFAQAATSLLYNTTPKSVGSTGTVAVTAATGGTQTITGQPFALRPTAAATKAPVVFHRSARFFRGFR